MLWIDMIFLYDRRTSMHTRRQSISTNTLDIYFYLRFDFRLFDRNNDDSHG